MRQINLLPSELKPSKQFGIALRKAIKYIVVFIIFYSVLVSAGMGTVYYFSGRLKDLTENKATLSSQIKSLSNVQTSVINIRDRVSKLEKIDNRDIEIAGLSDVGELYNIFPVTSKITNVTVSDNVVSFSISAPDTAVLMYVMDKLTTAGFFKKITLSDIIYKKETGYVFFLTAVF
jgi:hypothetical protein